MTVELMVTRQREVVFSRKGEGCFIWHQGYLKK